MVTATAYASATQALRESPLPHLRSLDVAEDETEVTLRGRVGSYYHKQLAQEAILHLLRGRRLHNLVIVQSR